MNIIALVLVILGALLLTLLADRAVGVFIEKPVDAAGLIFPPGSLLTYRTPEFTFTAEIYRLGFRDRKFAVTRGAGTRVLAIGDSFGAAQRRATGRATRPGSVGCFVGPTKAGSRSCGGRSDSNVPNLRSRFREPHT